jgi:hypothetical protein
MASMGLRARCAIAVLALPPAGLRVAMVPDAGIEPATFGLQNRCSTS